MGFKTQAYNDDSDVDTGLITILNWSPKCTKTYFFTDQLCDIGTLANFIYKGGGGDVLKTM